MITKHYKECFQDYVRNLETVMKEQDRKRNKDKALLLFTLRIVKAETSKGKLLSLLRRFFLPQTSTPKNRPSTSTR